MGGMDEAARIQSDIEQFHESAKKFSRARGKKRELVEQAARYCEDAKFYLKKKDHISAFGCINYAHGILDALKHLEAR
ncbi:MAG: DUF357 domain-containing protein [Candidatus Micrarchaeota archaeon]